MTSPAGFMSLGVPPPKKTFLEGRTPRQPSAGAHSAYTARPTSHTTPHHQSRLANEGNALASVDTKAVILNEHKVELMDMLHESVAMLKNIYRSKFTFGDHLRYVDPSYGGDTVNQFNLASPPSFDASYVPPAAGGAHPHQPTANNNATVGLGGAGGGSEDGVLKEKLRTAEELIKKLYRRNTQLETENKYIRGELSRMERFQGLGRTKSNTLAIQDGHLPLDHPLYIRSVRRSCRSCPPTRTLVRSAVNGSGLAFPPRGGLQDEPQPKEDPLPVAQMKNRVVQLTEALVTVQHENEKLVKEKMDRVSLRDALLRSYIVERDTQIAQLHRSLQDLINKVANPMKLTRAKQPASSINPVVATNNVLKDISQRLADQVSGLTSEMIKKASAALPDEATSPHRSSTALNGAAGGAAEETQLDNKNGGGGGGASLPMTRRRELARRLRAITDTLPIAKRKQMVLLLTELKQLFDGLAHSNRSLLATYENHKVKTNQDMVQLKLEVAMLRDELRAVDPEAAQKAQGFHAAGSGGGSGGYNDTMGDP